MSKADLQRAGCVRAFLGTPPLLMLEEPMLDAPADMLPPLLNACLQAMHRGAAVLWLTCQHQQLRNSRIPATRRYLVSAGEFGELRL
jgi:phospholipid/cholesterol/gamma-HCH transport system ATP-binding protein